MHWLLPDMWATSYSPRRHTS